MTKQTGFLTFRLGVQTVYCNRTKGGLWFTVSNGEPVKIDAVSFQSKSGGLRGLNIYEATRGGKDGWKVGLLLEDENSQVYKFETGSGTSFARGMLWAIASLSAEQAQSGQIGLNPTPADPAKTKSSNPGSILYCNMLCDGVELPYFMGEGRPDWQQIAQIALSKANGCEYPIAEVPASWVFSDDDEGKSYSQPASANKSGFSRQAPQSGRSGVTYPNAPLTSNSPAIQRRYEDQDPQRDDGHPYKLPDERSAATPPSPELEPAADEMKTIAFVSGLYSEFMHKIEDTYKVNAVTIDALRMAKFLERAQVKTFGELSITRKNQITVSLAIELVKAKAPGHAAIERLEEMLNVAPLTLDHFDALSTLTEQAFSELVPF